jgi:hypothetical protein
MVLAGSNAGGACYGCRTAEHPPQFRALPSSCLSRTSESFHRGYMAARSSTPRTGLLCHRATARVPILITVAKPEFSVLLSFASRPDSTQA